MTPADSRGRASTLGGRLAALGLDADTARRRLARVGLLEDERVDEALLVMIGETAEPDEALACIVGLAGNDRATFDAVCADPAWLRRVLSVAGASRPLGDLLARFPDAVDALRREQPLTLREVAAAIEAAVSASTDQDAQARNIAGIRRRATAFIAARDLTGDIDVEAVAGQLSVLAEGVLTGTLAALLGQLDGPQLARIAVIGMGKLGGEELNYVSDVDVIFVHAALDGADDRDATRQATVVVEQLLRLLNASTTMGRAYEVDPTLRPEGRAGALTRTVDSFVSYWERWAKTWEFQALIKARPVAGDPQLGARLLEAAEPFVYPDHLDPGVIAEVREMKGRVEAKPEVRRHGARQVKLGPGGLRDIEFAVQLLQLVHGRADAALRLTGTLPTLRALAEGGYVADGDADSFSDAYRTLRTVEHRLQLAAERRTHTIPDVPARQERLARSLGYRAEAGRPARERFLQELTAVQAEVRDLHAKLFYRPLLEVYASVAAADAGLARPEMRTKMGEGAARERLSALGFGDAAAALRHVHALTSGVTRQARVLRAVLPALLSALVDTPDPDVGLRLLRGLVEAQGDSRELQSLLRDHPPATELLARILGTSEVAGELLIAQPQGLDWLIDDESRATPRKREQVVGLALQRLRWQDRNDAVRRFKRHELLRIVMRDLSGQAPVSVVGEELTALAEACLEAALMAELTVAASEEGLDEATQLPFRMAIIGMGKLGGHELQYVSDLDVLFVHEAAPAADEDEATRLALVIAERVMGALGQITAEGTAFEVDADLRPEGRSGPLSRSLNSYRTYYERWSEPWEHQALLKARASAGDRDLAGRFLEFVRPYAYPLTFDDARVTTMRKMKARIERERIGRRQDPARHLKLGPGGMSDVEWTVQLLQQRHGAAEPLVRTTSTMAALDALQDAAFLDHRDASWLRDGYRFLTGIRNRLYLMRQHDVDVLPTGPVAARLARSLGYGRGGRQQLEDEFLRHARHVRRVTEQVFYEIPPEHALFGTSSHR